ncbi:hypothetical protein TNCV_4401811 [Trichonephila clavipes]|nr:hypothetical protein TNCV_4401811 [Trichonephila clavipes]
MRRPTGIVVSDADCGAHGGTLNSRRAASPLVWLVEGVRGVKPLATPGFHPSKLGWNRAESYCHLLDAQS